MIQIHLETEPRRVAEAKTGTWEQGRELALAYMWQIQMQTGPRRLKEANASKFVVGEGYILHVSRGQHSCSVEE